MQQETQERKDRAGHTGVGNLLCAKAPCAFPALHMCVFCFDVHCGHHTLVHRCQEV